MLRVFLHKANYDFLVFFEISQQFQCANRDSSRGSLNKSLKLKKKKKSLYSFIKKRIRRINHGIVIPQASNLLIK